MGRTVASYDLTDDERDAIVNALKIALAVPELDALKAHIRYDKAELRYQRRLIPDLEEVLCRLDK